MSAGVLSEDGVIETYFAPIAGPGGLRLRDDAALFVPPPGQDLVLTNDALVADVHFLADDAPDAIARKALRVNLSDLAAKGAAPAGFLLALALPGGTTATWLQRFAEALGEDSVAFGCSLLGGDTVRTPGPLTLSITAFGTVPSGRMLRRTGVRSGDLLYVSGTVGDAALGLKVRQGRADDAAWIARLAADHQAFLRDRYLLPQPRLALRAALLAHASAGMDVSDGFVGDLAKMLRVSGVGGEIELARIPLSEAARAAMAAADLFEAAVTGGDDYEILAAVAPEQAAAFEKAAAATHIRVTAVGTATGRPDEAPRFRDAAGAARTFRSGSYSHF